MILGIISTIIIFIAIERVSSCMTYGSDGKPGGSSEDAIDIRNLEY